MLGPNQPPRTSTEHCTVGTALPVWLAAPGPVLLRTFNRSTKQDDLVEEVDLVEANPSYAFIPYRDGRESTGALKDLAPSPRSPTDISPRPGSTREEVQSSIHLATTFPRSRSPEDDAECASSLTEAAPPDSAGNPVVTTPVSPPAASPALHPNSLPEQTVPELRRSTRSTRG